MVGNGVALVGDAASLVNPIHGGGIGPSMLSGYLQDNKSWKRWIKVNRQKKRFGATTRNTLKPTAKNRAALDIFRMFLLSCSDEDLNYGMDRETHD